MVFEKTRQEKGGWQMFTLGFGLSGFSNEKVEYVCVEDLEPIYPSSHKVVEFFEYLIEYIYIYI